MTLETYPPLLHFNTYLVAIQLKISVFPANTYGEEVTFHLLHIKRHTSTDAPYLSVALYYFAAKGVCVWGGGPTSKEQ